ncbi:transcriptional regulator EutR [Rubripirellula tenax]|uniref:Transcriptional regulator EutR n=1 Tax=Rubripirellula tenax TaxID=2528015 RepID=A0A5C6FJM2_9BACT|nr:helix-turn-helix domain-containing protein [Rubripirellula tenax]TWU60813.1 transcriptional regulator EutR [Rubripirellula tenax]
MKPLTHSETITDPAEWDGSIFGTQLELVQLAGPGFVSTQTVTELRDGVKLLRLTVNQPITVRSRPLSKRYAVTSFDRTHEGHFAGVPINENQLLIFPPDFDFDASIKDSGFRCSTIFAPPKPLRRYYKTLVGEEIEEFHSTLIANPPPDSVEWLAAWPSLVDDKITESLETQQRIDFQESLRDEALNLLVCALQTAAKPEFSEEMPRLSKARQLIRIAEDYANGNPEHGLRMVDLCNATGVSERTLQYAFQTCLGISPINYLKRMRLQRARRQLKVSNSKQTTVAAIACQMGFWHFGEFSKAYKAQFDESPSTTLRGH